MTGLQRQLSSLWLLTLPVLVLALMAIDGRKVVASASPRLVYERIISYPFAIINVANINMPPDIDDDFLSLGCEELLSVFSSQRMSTRKILIAIQCVACTPSYRISSHRGISKWEIRRGFARPR